MESIPLKGVGDLVRNLNEQIEKMGNATRKGVEDVVLDLQAKSQAIVPHDQGDLEGSANWDVEESGVKISASVYYNTPYAVIQHEDLDFRHEPGRQAKYLEQPLNENRDRYIEHIADENRKVNS